MLSGFTLFNLEGTVKVECERMWKSNMGQSLSWLEHTTDNREVDGSSPFWPTTSKQGNGIEDKRRSDQGAGTGNGLESRLFATVRWTVATGVAFPQKSESILAHHF